MIGYPSFGDVMVAMSCMEGPTGIRTQVARILCEISESRVITNYTMGPAAVHDRRMQSYTI